MLAPTLLLDFSLHLLEGATAAAAAEAANIAAMEATAARARQLDVQRADLEKREVRCWWGVSSTAKKCRALSIQRMVDCWTQLVASRSEPGTLPQAPHLSAPQFPGPKLRSVTTPLSFGSPRLWVKAMCSARSPQAERNYW